MKPTHYLIPCAGGAGRIRECQATILIPAADANDVDVITKNVMRVGWFALTQADGMDQDNPPLLFLMCGECLRVFKDSGRTLIDLLKN